MTKENAKLKYNIFNLKNPEVSKLILFYKDVLIK